MSLQVETDPPLPFRNLLKNSGFEERLSEWKILRNDDDKVLITSLESFGGKSALYISKSENQGHTGVYQIQSAFDVVPERGKEYIVGCYVKSNGTHGGLHVGAGVSLSVFDKNWKTSESVHARTLEGGEWNKIVSKPLAIPSWAEHYNFNSTISYSSGVALIDDVFLQEAYTTFTIKASGDIFRQIILEDERGYIVYDSGELPADTKNFSKTLKVLSPFTYKVKVINKKGNIYAKLHPERTIQNQENANDSIGKDE